VIRAERLTRSLQKGEHQLHLLKGLSFQVERGEWTALTGPSGSGKSTLLGLLAGIDTPTGGTLVVDGLDIAEMSERRLARVRKEVIGMVFQSCHLIPTLTAQENVEVPMYIGPQVATARKLRQICWGWLGCATDVVTGLTSLRVASSSGQPSPARWSLVPASF
jgi:putative ABC transport system ATP-binding protein